VNPNTSPDGLRPNLVFENFMQVCRDWFKIGLKLQNIGLKLQNWFKIAKYWFKVGLKLQNIGHFIL
jgi:hypothetical protein